jgi:hypothetical protein
MILNMFWSISETGAMIGKQLFMSGGKMATLTSVSTMMEENPNPIHNASKHFTRSLRS